MNLDCRDIGLSCDNCGLYDENRFTHAERLLHQSWELAHETPLSNLTVCYCEPGWTGFGDFSAYGYEVFEFCSINTIYHTIMWYCFVIQSIFLAVRDSLWIVNWSRKQKYADRTASDSTAGSGDHSNAAHRYLHVYIKTLLRIMSHLSFLTLGLLKIHSQPFEYRIAFSPISSVLYFVATSTLWRYIYEIQQRETMGYFKGIFKDIGFREHLEEEHKFLQRFTQVVQLMAPIAGILPLVAACLGTRDSLVYVWNLSIITYLVALIMDLWVVTPRTTKRLLVLVTNIAKKTLKSEESQMQAIQLQQQEVGKQVQKIKLNVKKRYFVRVGLMMPAAIACASVLVVPGSRFYTTYGMTCWSMFYSYLFLYGVHRSIRRPSMKTIATTANKFAKVTPVESEIDRTSTIHTTDVSAFQSS